MCLIFFSVTLNDKKKKTLRIMRDQLWFAASSSRHRALDRAPATASFGAAADQSSKLTAAEGIAGDFTEDDTFFLAPAFPHVASESPSRETCCAYTTERKECGRPARGRFCMQHAKIKGQLDKIKSQDYNDANTQIWCRLTLFLGYYRDECKRHLDWIEEYAKLITVNSDKEAPATMTYDDVEEAVGYEKEPLTSEIDARNFQLQAAKELSKKAPAAPSIQPEFDAAAMEVHSNRMQALVCAMNRYKGHDFTGSVWFVNDYLFAFLVDWREQKFYRFNNTHQFIVDRETLKRLLKTTFPDFPMKKKWKERVERTAMYIGEKAVQTGLLLETLLSFAEQLTNKRSFIAHPIAVYKIKSMQEIPGVLKKNCPIALEEQLNRNGSVTISTKNCTTVYYNDKNNEAFFKMTPKQLTRAGKDKVVREQLKRAENEEKAEKKQHARDAAGIDIIVNSEDIERMRTFLNGLGNRKTQVVNDTYLLHTACVYKKNVYLEMLLNAGADVNSWKPKDNPEYRTPLKLCCQVGNYDAITTLLKSRADTERSFEKSVTAIGIACIYDFPECVKLLIENRANVNALDETNRTPLMYACVYGHLECTKALLGVEAIEVDRRETNTGYTALTACCEEGHVDCAQLLLKKNANKELKTKESFTALMLSCQSGRRACAKLLIDSDANVEAQNDNTGANSLMLACLGNHLACVIHLITANANLDAVNKEGQTSLMISCVYGHELCADALLKNDASADIKTEKGMTALMLACWNNRLNCVQKLLAMCHACKYAIDNNGWTPLMFACHHGSAEGVSLLLSNGANASRKAKGGKTPLMIACENHHTQCAQKTLEDADAFINRNECDDQGWTALMHACINDSVETETVKMLLGKNVEPNFASPTSGRTALMIACAYGNEYAFGVLVRSGANISLKDHDGNTALSLAKEELKPMLKNYVEILGNTPVLHDISDATSLSPKANLGPHLPKLEESPVYHSTPGLFKAPPKSPIHPILGSGLDDQTEDDPTDQTDQPEATPLTNKRRPTARNLDGHFDEAEQT